MEARAAARGVPNPAAASPLSDRWTSCRRRKWGAAGWVSPAGRAGWRCDRRRRREGGRGAGARYRTAGAPSRPAAARCVPPAASLVLRLALLLHVAVAQVHLDQVRHDEANAQQTLAGQRNLAAEGDSVEAVEQHEAYQPKLVSEPQAVRAVHQRARHGLYDPFVMQRHGSTCLSHVLDVRDNVNGHDQHHRRCPRPRAQALATHRVVHAVDQHAAD
eukprot:scaffold10193_cov75-Phaeocystis_antarctica.AAC.2